MKIHPAEEYVHQELYISATITGSWYEKWSVAALIVKKNHLNECLLVLLYTAEKKKCQGYRYPGK